MRLLLDSATFLWMAAGATELSNRATELLTDASNELHLSAVSAWEIAVKHRAGRLDLADEPDRLIPAARDVHGVLPLPFDEESGLHLARLPEIHRDPFDRMLVCQAIVNGLAILTPDEQIHAIRFEPSGRPMRTDRSHGESEWLQAEQPTAHKRQWPTPISLWVAQPR